MVTIFAILTPSIHAQNFVLPNDKPTISVIGEAEKQISSDQSKISLVVENTAIDSIIVRKDNAEKIAQNNICLKFKRVDKQKYINIKFRN
jgi:uncharacterized protein YggE